MKKVILTLLFFVIPAKGEVKLPTLFGDHMVLQQEKTLPVWGWANAGEKVTVTAFGNTAAATTGSDGKWHVDLPALAGGTPAGTLTVVGTNTITINDVLVGDVWLCSGQSNMEFVLRNANGGAAAVAGATDPLIRLFHVPHEQALGPRDQVPGKWEVCSPKSVSDFTAVGYFFARELRPVIKRPMGLIESNVGGTPAEAWTDLPTLQSHPELKHYADTFAKIMEKYPGGDAEYAAKSAEYDIAAAKMLEASKTNPAYQAAISKWKLAVKATPPGQPAPMQPRPPQPRTLGVQKTAPTVLFNGMIAPLIPYPIKGEIWYQGESNAGKTADAADYETLFPAMITDWRTLWKEGDFPFLYVQLANFTAPNADWPRLRESQLKTLTLPATGMAVIIDIGTRKNIHPTDKADVGRRLSLAARHIAYGEHVVYTGPLYDSMKIEGNRIRISFKSESVGSGLTIGKAPWVDPNGIAVSGTELEGFMIAGDDKKWMPATASVDGDSLLVGNAQVTNPVAVRYGWADNPTCNLYNKEGLPASPFRTDNWESTSPATSVAK